MDQTLIDKVSSAIYVKHPDFRGVKPKITKKTDDQFLLLFKQNQKNRYRNGHRSGYSSDSR